MEIRALTPAEQKYTYAQSMQLEGQTSNIGHLRGDFASSGYGFYTTWFDTRPQWKTDEFKKELDEVINSLREDKGLLHNRYDMSAFAKHYPESAFAGSYCTEYGFRVDTEKHAFLFRCNPTKGDYNFYCYCFVKEWLDKHIQKAEQGIRFIDPNYKELFRIPDGGKIIITSSWGEKTERPCRFIDEYHTEIGNNIFHICEFAERNHDNKANLRLLRQRSDELCREYALSVIEHPSGKKKPYALYQAEKNGMPTRDNVTRQAVDEAISKSFTLKDFDRIMAEMGYRVSFDPNRKYWTVIGKGWKRPKRLYKLGEEYTNERIMERITENSYAVKFSRFTEPQRTVKVFRVKGSLTGAKKIGGLRGLYLHYTQTF